MVAGHVFIFYSLMLLLQVLEMPLEVLEVIRWLDDASLGVRSIGYVDPCVGDVLEMFLQVLEIIRWLDDVASRVGDVAIGVGDVATGVRGVDLNEEFGKIGED